MRRLLFAIPCLLLPLSPAALGQGIQVQIDGGKVQVQMPDAAAGAGAGRVTVDSQGSHVAAGQGNSASVSTGIDPGAQVQGVSVINGTVYVDGEKVPPGVTRFTGKSGKTYVIDRKGGAVSVHDE